jgi:hypothetical protein
VPERYPPAPPPPPPAHTPPPPPPAITRYSTDEGATFSVVNETAVEPGPEPKMFTARRYTEYAVFGARLLIVIGLITSAGLKAVHVELLNEYS